MAALSFLEKHPDDFIGAERPPLNFQQLSGHRLWSDAQGYDAVLVDVVHLIEAALNRARTRVRMSEPAGY
jgi:hypothetical protein